MDKNVLEKFQKFLTPVNNLYYGPLETLTFNDPNYNRLVSVNDKMDHYIEPIFSKFNDCARKAFKEAKVDMQELHPLDVNKPYVDSDNSNQLPMRNIVLLHQWVSIHGYTAFHCAVRSDLLPIVKEYLKPEFYYDSESKEDNSRQEEIASVVIRFLLMKPTIKGYSPLVSSCDKAISADVFNTILNAGKKYLGTGALFRSFLLCRTNGPNTDSKATRDYGLTAFHSACRLGLDYKVKAILDAAKEIDRKNNNHSLTEELFLNTTKIDKWLDDPLRSAKGNAHYSLLDYLKKEAEILYTNPGASEKFKTHMKEFEHFKSNKLKLSWRKGDRYSFPEEEKDLRKTQEIQAQGETIKYQESQNQFQAAQIQPLQEELRAKQEQKSSAPQTVLFKPQTNISAATQTILHNTVRSSSSISPTIFSMSVKEAKVDAAETWVQVSYQRKKGKKV